jgi:flagellar hook assembly protein FlgD
MKNKRFALVLGMLIAAAVVVVLVARGYRLPGGNTSGTMGAATANSISLEVASPRSAVCPMTLHYSIHRPANVSLTICDPNGWVVKSLVDDPMTAGAHEVTWDGSDGLGHAVRGNAYIAVLRANGGVANQPFILRPRSATVR